ncbi:MAG: hypothetical protein K8J09_20690, partial [Planctomycetes bacterium]|nr:hypothetical protein [Planctomycetota bacterium]
MSRSLPLHLLAGIAPALTATVLAWPAFFLRGHVTMVLLVVASAAVAFWQHRQAGTAAPWSEPPALAVAVANNTRQQVT